MTAPTLIVLSGLSGAGKSTLAHKLVEETNAVLISRDELEKAVVTNNCVDAMNHLMWLAATIFLTAGRSVVIDAWNLHPVDRPIWQYIATTTGAALVWRHLSTPVEVCIARDAKRPNPVGRVRIERAAKEYGLAA